MVILLLSIMHGSSDANEIYQIPKSAMVYNADKFQ